MKKPIITIIILILIALAFIAYKSNSSLFDNGEKDTTVIVKNFLNMMIPHHAEAVEASLLVMNDVDITEPKARILAANIVDTQSFEVDKMKNIYRDYLGAEYDVSASTYSGTIRDLTALKGDALAKAYTTDMIKHHKHAIDIAEDYIKIIDKVTASNTTSNNGLIITNSHPAIDESYELAKEIVRSQSIELEEMESWY